MASRQPGVWVVPMEGSLAIQSGVEDPMRVEIEPSAHNASLDVVDLQPAARDSGRPRARFVREQVGNRWFLAGHLERESAGRAPF